MYKLDILHHSVKSVETKSQKVLGLILTVAEVTGEKLVGGGGLFAPPPLLPPILNRVNISLIHWTENMKLEPVLTLWAAHYQCSKRVQGVCVLENCCNTQIYTLGSSPHTTHFSGVAAMTWKRFEQIFVSIQANPGHRQQMTTTKLLQKYLRR